MPGRASLAVITVIWVVIKTVALLDIITRTGQISMMER